MKFLQIFALLISLVLNIPLCSYADTTQTVSTKIEFVYDVTGALVPSTTQRVEYTSFQRPSKIVQGRDSVSLIYDQDYNRIGQHNYSNGGSTKFYFGDVYEKSFIHSVSIETIYIGGDYYTAPAVYMRMPSNPWKVYFLLAVQRGTFSGIIFSSNS